jgi:hypothetical protein
MRKCECGYILELENLAPTCERCGAVDTDHGNHDPYYDEDNGNHHTLTEVLVVLRETAPAEVKSIDYEYPSYLSIVYDFPKEFDEEDYIAFGVNDEPHLGWAWSTPIYGALGGVVTNYESVDEVAKVFWKELQDQIKHFVEAVNG